MALDVTTLLNLGLYLAFDIDADGRVLAGSDESGSTQLVELSPDGSAVPLTALPGPCSGRYLPGQRAVIVSHDEGGNERHQLSVLRLPRPGGQPASLGDLEPLVRDPEFMHVLAEVTDGRICYLTNRRNGVAFDPVIRDLASGTERTPALGDHHYAGAALSRDGRWLALIVSSPVTANAEHVALVDLTVPPGTERLIDVTPPDAPALNHTPRFAPGSDALYFTSNNDREFAGVARYDLAAGTTRWLVVDEEFDLAGWLSPDGGTLLVERNDDGASRFALHDAATGGHLRDLPLPWPGCQERTSTPVWAPDSAAVAISWSGPDTPGDAVLLRTGPDRPAPRLLTHSARGLGRDRAVHPELHRVPAADGAAISCQVYRAGPAADQSGDLAGSAVLFVHGGPESQARQEFIPYVQILAAAGHTVLVPNVRGSTGYGKRWYSADDKHGRMASVDDLAALHAWLPKLGLDQSRTALWGASYGGYMVLAGLAFQPALWAAGVDIVGIASLVTFLENTSGYRRAYREREYGTLAADREFLHSVSPLTRAADIVAPLLLIHGANDPRVPLSEAEQLHAAMRSRGRECELLVYGDEGHGLRRRKNRADAVPRAVAFLARHLARTSADSAAARSA